MHGPSVSVVVQAFDVAHACVRRGRSDVVVGAKEKLVETDGVTA